MRKLVCTDLEDAFRRRGLTDTPVLVEIPTGVPDMSAITLWATGIRSEGDRLVIICEPENVRG